MNAKAQLQVAQANTAEQSSKSTVADSSAKSQAPAAVSAVVSTTKGKAMATDTTSKQTLTYKEQLKALREQRQAVLDRYQADEATDEDEKSLLSLNKQIKVHTGEREKSLSGLKEQIRSLGLEPGDVFEKSQVQAAFNEMFPSTKPSKPSKSGGKGVTRTRKPVDLTKLIINKSGKGGGIKILKDEFEAGKFGAYAKVYLKKLATDSKTVDDFAASLIKENALVNDGAAFIKTAKGKESLEKLYTFSRTAKLTPKAA